MFIGMMIISMLFRKNTCEILFTIEQYVRIDCPKNAD